MKKLNLFSLSFLKMFLVVLSFCLVSTATLHAQSNIPDFSQRELSIKVFEKGTGLPLRKVEIKYKGMTYFTDPNGISIVLISQKNTPEVLTSERSVKDKEEITFLKSGFVKSALPANEIEKLELLEIYLDPEMGADDEVIVRGRRRPSISKKVISSAEAARVSPGGDPGQVTKLLPGVTTQPGKSEVTIRGSKPADSAYFLDDIRVPFVYHTIGNLSVLPPSIIEDVEFSAGGFGAEYGNATGGIVVLRSKNNIPERSKTTFNLNLPVYSGVYHERPLSEDSGIFIGTRRSYLEYILPRFLPKDSGVTVVPYFRDYQGIYVKKLEDGHYKLSLLASTDGLKATAPSESSIDASGQGKFFVQTYFGAVAVERMKKLSSDWSVTSTPQVVYTDNEFEINDLKFHVQGLTLRVPTEFVQKVSADEKMYLGAEASYVPYKVTYYIPRFDPDDPFYDVEEAPKVAGHNSGSAYDAAAWLARDFKLDNGGILSPGLRVFYASAISRASADPRLQYRQQVKADHALKVAIGQYSQNPKNGEPAKDFGNPKLMFPKAMHYILGVESKWSDRWDTDFQVFFKDMKLVIRSDPVTNYNNKGSLQSYGFETFIRRALTERWFGWVSYTWSKTRERKDQSTGWYPGENDQTHVVNVTGSCKVNSTWDVGGRVGWHTGDAYTSKVGDSVYNANLDKYQSRSNSKVNGSRLPDYHELSLFSAHDFLFNKWKSTLKWGVEYFWFQRQAYGARPNYDYSKEEYFKGVPPIPYLELRGEI